MNNNKIVKTFSRSVSALIWLIAFLLALVVFLILCLQTNILKNGKMVKNDSTRGSSLSNSLVNKSDSLWHAPSENEIPKGTEGNLIRYGRDLIVRTSFYLGPKGIVSATTNGMNCQNCHLEAGTKPFGNNFSGVASTYPKFRPRSGTIETIEKKVGDCFERSLNGKSPADDSKEMKAIVAYINWLGKDVPKGIRPNGAGLIDLKFMTRAADPANGKLVYDLKCKSCHSENGEGQKDSLGVFIYPPLWGPNSYNIGAGLFRLSRFAGYVKANMPAGTSYAKTQLSEEEAWDVAAFVNSQKRPKKDLSKDWPDKSKKPVDHPFGPFTDQFSEQQHKYGPFAPIKAAHAVMK